MISRATARLWVRVLLSSCAAAVPAAAWAAEDGTDQGANARPIVVTGRRQPDLQQTPSTTEGLDANRIDRTTNVVNPEDSLRYLPSLFVRKRHIGDTQSPLATRTSGVGASARSLVYADGVLLSALIGNNNSNASPRWAMVSPEEIERVDVLYGPFAAAYPGNSIGAVVNITTRLPDGPEGSLTAATSLQHFDQYWTSGTYPAVQLAGTWGGRAGPLSWFVGADHVSSRSQPLAYVTIARPALTGAAGLPVAGGFPDLNRAGAPIFVIGAGGFEDQRQDNLKLKLGLDLGPSLRLIYRGGLFLNDTDASAQSYLAGPDGQPAYSGSLNILGRPTNVPASAFSNNVYRLDERHWMHALSLEGGSGRLQWRAIGSLYDYGRDVQRAPSIALPVASAGGAGSIVRMDGTGWRTLDLGGRWQPAGEVQDLSFGGHYDGFRLASDRFATSDWIAGPQGASTQAARGRTRTFALWTQDRLTLSRTFELTLGARYEWWRAFDGFNFSLAPALSVDQPERDQQGFSPKASLSWRPAPSWRVTLSAAQAWRFPTVTELYQAIATGPTLTVPDPDLRPERARSEELAVERSFADGRIRLSLFNEAIRDALISQTAPLLPGSTSLFSFVQNIGRVRTYGAELVVDWRNLLIPGLGLSGSLTLANPKVVDDPAFPAAEGKDLPQVPRRRASLVLTYQPGERAAFTLAGRYASRSFATIDNSDPVTHTYQGFDGYLVLDARATFQLSRHLEAALGVDNLTNRSYFIFHPFPQRSVIAELHYRW
jgi:iron complex outermembrane receptor protein